MKSAAVLGTATLASLLLVACGSKTADKAADSSASGSQEITFYVEDQYKASRTPRSSGSERVSFSADFDVPPMARKVGLRVNIHCE